MGLEQNFSDFLTALDRLPEGYFTGVAYGALYGVTVKRAVDGKRVWLYAEALGAGDHVSFNLYRLAKGKTLLKPCEMSERKVIDFVLSLNIESELEQNL